MNFLAFARNLIRDSPGLVFVNTALLVLTSLIGVVAVFSVAPVVDIVSDPSLQDVSDITESIVAQMRSAGLPVTAVTVLALFLVLHALKSAVSVVAQYFLLRTKYAVLQDVMVGTYADLFGAKWEFFSSSERGRLLNTFSREAAAVGDAFGALTRIFASVVQVTFYLVVPFFLFWRVMSVSLLAAIVCIVPILLLGRLSYHLGQQNTATSNALFSIIHESLSLAKVILSFGRQSAIVAKFAAAYEAHRRVTVRSQTLQVATPLMYEPLGLLVIALTLLMAQKLGFPLADIGVGLWALRQAIPLIGAIASQRNEVVNFSPSYEQVSAIRGRAVGMKQASGSKPFERLSDELCFENVGFSYGGAETDDNPALVDLDLRIRRGQLVAVVGASGAGKSTIADLVLGLQEPTSGRITIDGAPLADYDISSYRRHLGYVPQESVLFNTSIRQNLLWAVEDATDKDIELACRQANAHDFICNLPEAYHTVVGDRGVRLSGGQCQRIALARAILMKPQLLVLDEATSALDTESERLIQAAIETIAEETTVIAIAHRLSTISQADYVYVMDSGRVVEEGPYAELAGGDGVFRRMVTMQNIGV
jgi:ABC-type multidrug transport system fused ATPase/permease subunit